jgi:hypothetical protein
VVQVALVRRALVVSVVVLGAAVLAACQPPPPAGWTAPEITAIQVEPAPVAGEPFVVRVTVQDDELVDDVAIVIEPTYAIDGHSPRPYEHVDCEGPPVVAAPVVTVEFTCTMAAFSPNGPWSLIVRATNANAPSQQERTTTFQLTGGTEDREPPVLESLVISPDPVVRGEPYSVTMRISDEHLVLAPRSFGLRNVTDVLDPAAPPGVHWPCGEAEPTVISPTEIELRWDGCTIGPDAVLGDYYSYVGFEDLIGHPSSTYARTQLVAAP